MELLELRDRTLELFQTDIEHLGDSLMECIRANATERYDAFAELVGDLSTDWMQMIFQYYHADRKEKKQDYTPASLAQLMGMLAGDSDRIVDMCAGSGALIIQKWAQNQDTVFTAIEYDGSVIPFLLFNMVLRNIRCRVYHADALTDDDPVGVWDVMKGERYGNLVDLKSTLQPAP